MHHITACPSAQVGIGCGSRDELPDQGASVNQVINHEKPLEIHILNPKMEVWKMTFPFQTADFQVPC